MVGEDQASWSQADWDDCIRTNHVLLGTAALFQQGFVTDKFFQVECFSLIVFDECHNATGNSPMAAVMRDAVAPVLVTGKTTCPRILGLTASFVNGNLRNMEKKRRDIESLLQSTIFCPNVKAKLEDDRFIYVPWKRNKNADIHKQAIEKHVENAVNQTGRVKDVRKIINRCSHVFEQLGTGALFFYIDKVIVQQIIEKANSMKDYDDRSTLYARRMLSGLDELKMELNVLAQTLGTDPLLKEAATRSSKVEELLKLLKQIFDTNGSEYRGIVFCEQVALVSTLTKELNDALGAIRIRCGAVAGTGSQSERDRQQQLDKFKNGNIRLLVATASLEEGIDVPECAFVVRFNFIATTKAHIQGAGRARHPNAVIYYFDNNPVGERRKEASMKTTAKNSTLSLSDQEIRTAAGAMSTQIDLRHPFPFPSLGAAESNDGQVNVFNCKQIFNQYCSIMLGTSIQPKKVLYKYSNQPGDRNILKSIRYPTPHGWHKLSAEDFQIFWGGVDFDEVFSAERSKRKSASEKEEMAFVYLVAVELRKQGFLNRNNRPEKSLQFDTKRRCSLAADWSDAIRVKDTVFQSVKQADDAK